MFGAFKRMFRGAKSSSSSSFTKTKVTRKFGPDGQLVEEVVETEGVADAGEATDAARAQAGKVDEFFKTVDEAFEKVDEAFDKLFDSDNEPTDQE